MTQLQVDLDVPAPMRDGTVLRADVYRPSAAGPWPVLLMRVPYGKRGISAFNFDAVGAAERGYVVVVQDTRGRNRSGGEWQPWEHERADGFDTVMWAASLPGSDGQVGMWGASYAGNTQWMAALDQPAPLRAIAPQFTWCDPRDGQYARGGALELGHAAPWSLSQGFDVLGRRLADRPAERTQVLEQLAEDHDGLVTATYWETPTASFPPLVRHGLPELSGARALRDPSFVEACSVAGLHAQVLAPSYNISGWYDLFSQGTIDNFLASRAAGRPTRLLMGPWIHTPQSAQAGDLNFGVRAGGGSIDLSSSLFAEQLRWFDRWLKQIGNGIDEEPPVRIFVMGPNRWRDEDTWPPVRFHPAPLYLASGGRLDARPPTVPELPDTYGHDPADPVPSVGGNMLLSSEYRSGPVDQRDVEIRADVLTYTSPVLARDLEITGRITVCLFASSAAASADWVARLCVVRPDGQSYNLVDGVTRVSSPPGQAAEHQIDLWSTSVVVGAGHRLRLQVTSSCFPRWERNLEPSARQTVFHDPDRPSVILLPVAESTLPLEGAR